MFSKSSKTLLRNAIRHADIHNRHVEEGDMWTVRNRELNYAREQNNSKPMRRAHMDRESRASTGGESRRSTYWARELEKAEAADPDRWGHGGYREMYPDDFDSERSGSESDSHGHSSKKAKKSKPSRKNRTRDVRQDRTSGARQESSSTDSRRKDKTVITLYSSVHPNKSDHRIHPNKSDNRRSQKGEVQEGINDTKHSSNNDHKQKSYRKRHVSESDSEQENVDSKKCSKQDSKSGGNDRDRSSHKHLRHKKRSHGSKHKKSRSHIHEGHKSRRTFKDRESSSESD